MKGWGLINRQGKLIEIFIEQYRDEGVYVTCFPTKKALLAVLDGSRGSDEEIKRVEIEAIN